MFALFNLIPLIQATIEFIYYKEIDLDQSQITALAILILGSLMITLSENDNYISHSDYYG